MKIVLSRKGFDTGSGGVPSPIVDGRPISLPIPATRNAATTYDDLGFGDHVERVTKGRIHRGHLCHHDPMFADGTCIFGQCDAAQSHLDNQGVSVGDVFLFFGLFGDQATDGRHHRFFGYMRIKERFRVDTMSAVLREDLIRLQHPHVFGVRSANNTVYRGEGDTARHCSNELRLTRTAGRPSQWIVPRWLRERGLSYHSKATRWNDIGELQAVARGQEFVCDIGDDPIAHAWVQSIIEQIRS